MECRDDPGSATGVLVCTMVSCFVLMSYCMCNGKGLCGQSGFFQGVIRCTGALRHTDSSERVPGDQCNLCNRLETSQYPPNQKPYYKAKHLACFDHVLVKVGCNLTINVLEGRHNPSPSTPLPTQQEPSKPKDTIVMLQKLRRPNLTGIHASWQR